MIDPMSLRRCRVVVTNPHLTDVHSEIGEIVDYRIHPEIGLWFAVRFVDHFKMLSHKDVKIHPDDLSWWQQEAEKRWRYNNENKE